MVKLLVTKVTLFAEMGQSQPSNYTLMRCIQHSASDMKVDVVKPAAGRFSKVGLDVSSSFLTFPILGLVALVREERDAPIIVHSAE